MQGHGQQHPAWKPLLEWLVSKGMDTSSDKLLVEPRQTDGAGYGLYALKNCDPSTPLFDIPASALINIKTLEPHYPRTAKKLTAVQLVSLHLFLHRPQAGAPSGDALFGPYISTLPQDFDAHPLTWLTRQKLGVENEPEVTLLKKIPESVRCDLEQIASKFDADWNACRAFLRGNASLLKRKGDVTVSNLTSYTEDFLWAWLNVNTRCIYKRLKSKASDPDNFTMCPVLDFANHTTNRPHTYPTPTDADVWDVPPSRKCKDFGLSSPLNYRVSAGEELYLLYGCHSNRVLFTEYGFVQDIPAEGGFSSDFTGDINLSPWIERLFQERGEVGLGMERVLRDEGYWGDWTMHAAPRPAHPSFRVVIALRLYSLFAHLNTEDSIEADASALDSWRDTVLGKADTISPDNEAAWRKVLLNICEDMIGTARAEMAAEWGQAAWNVPEWFWRMRDNVLALWKEEVVVASAVMSSMERGELF